MISQVLTVLQRLVPLVQQASIDEFYLDVTGMVEARLIEELKNMNGHASSEPLHNQRK